MASTAMRPLFLNDDSVSLRSFRLNASPPSLKASSLKVKGSLAFANLLGSRGRTTRAEKYPQPTLRDLTQASYEADQDGFTPSSSEMPHMNVNGTTEVQTEEAVIQRPRSKSRTIIRMLSTKFIPRAVSSPTLVRPPPTISNAYSKEQRDAALRERGLLPPLRPNKDLSTQEFEQDQHIPIVRPVEEVDEHSEEAASAADLIKKEWVSKNHGVEIEQRQRMDSFKFGGSSSPVPPSPLQENGLPQSLAAEDQVASPLAEQPTAPPNEPLPAVSLPEELVLLQLPTSSANALSIPPSDAEATNRSPSPLFELSDEIRAFMFPLPPSPSISATELTSPPRSPTSQVPPPSPSLRNVEVADAPQSENSCAGGSGANTPRPVEVRQTSTPTTPAAPVISLTPATEIPFPTTGTAPPDDTLSSAFHTRTDSFGKLEESASIMTPSLDSTSQTTADSTTGTTDSASNSSSAAKGPGKLGMLQVKTHEGATIPVIIESPVEMSRFSEELAVVVEEGPSMDTDEFDEKSANPPVVTVVAPESTTAPAPRAPGLRPPKRGLTEPTGNMDRRKSLNPFKRGQTVGSGAVSANAGAEPQRRLSMATSLSNMRRSVVGTLSRPKGTGLADNGKKFNASHLPPSPTLPRVSAGSRGASSPPPTPRRQAVAPVMYNRGSILLETAGIEDEESRRMTELAFLG